MNCKTKFAVRVRWSSFCNVVVAVTSLVNVDKSCKTAGKSVVSFISAKAVWLPFSIVLYTQFCGILDFDSSICACVHTASFSPEI